MFERILVPMDGSRFSTQALDYAIEIAKRFCSETILMRVITPAARKDVLALSAEADEVARESAQVQDRRNIEQAKRYLGTKIQQVTAQAVKGSTHVVVGDPAQSIIEFCKKNEVNLIVMMTHGKSGFKRAILGSVADRVIRESGLPVLAIRSPRG